MKSDLNYVVTLDAEDLFRLSHGDVMCLEAEAFGASAYRAPQICIHLGVSPGNVTLEVLSKQVKQVKQDSSPEKIIHRFTGFMNEKL